MGFMTTMAGTGLNPCCAPGGQTFALFLDGHSKAMPKLVGGPFRYNEYAADSLVKALKFASKPMMQAVIAPSMVSLLMPLHAEVPGYTREQFESDLVDECEKDIRKAFAAGAARVQIDFTEGRLALKSDPRNPWTDANLLPRFIELISRVVDRFTPEERVNIGVHTCAGSDADSNHSAEVPYSSLLPALFSINAGYFTIQAACEEDKDETYKMIGEHSRDDADGIPQICYVGVIWCQNPAVETPQQVCDSLVRAADFIPKERLGSTDDCGFQPFAIDKKPAYGSPDFARDIAFEKIASRAPSLRRRNSASDRARRHWSRQTSLRTGWGGWLAPAAARACWPGLPGGVSASALGPRKPARAPSLPSSCETLRITFLGPLLGFVSQPAN